jgi:uncharacterized protein
VPNTLSAHGPAVTPRLIRAGSGWWFLGGGGRARVRPAQVTADGMLVESAERYLRDAGLYDTAPYTAYSLTVLTSTDCNLGCGYCFQNTGQDPNGGDRPPRIEHARLTPERIGTVLDFTRARMAESGLEQLFVTLFGGEPLLNPRGCRELLERAADLNLTWATMTSNGTLLTPLIARDLNRAGLKHVQITFDGDRPQHDDIRVKRSGGGTFDVITSNMAKAMDSTDLRWTLRVNVSHLNWQGMDSLVERLAERLDPSRCTLYFARIGDIGVGYANRLTHEAELAGEFVRWYSRALDLGFAIRQPGAKLPCPTCSFTDGKYGAVVNADGVLSSCWETAGHPGWEVGTITDGYLPAQVTAERWTTCYDRYRHDEDASVRDAFEDRVDAAVLDRLYATGQL